MIDWDTTPPDSIPAHLWPGLRAYVLDGRPTGQFLQAVISNDLKASVARADHESVQHLVDLVRFLYNETPGGCWGSPERYKYWVKEGGARGVHGEAFEKA